MTISPMAINKTKSDEWMPTDELRKLAEVTHGLRTALSIISINYGPQSRHASAVMAAHKALTDIILSVSNEDQIVQLDAILNMELLQAKARKRGSGIA